MKVLHITETMASGVLKYIQEVVSAQGSEHIDHYVVYSNRQYTPIEVAKLFPESVCLINVDIKLNRGCIQTIQTLFKHIDSIKPDLIHLHSSIAGFFGRIVALRFPKIR